MHFGDNPLTGSSWLLEHKGLNSIDYIKTIWKHPPSALAKTDNYIDHIRVVWDQADSTHSIIPNIGLQMEGRLKPLLNVGLLAANLLRRRAASGSIQIQFHDEEPPGIGLKIDAPVMQSSPHDGVIPDPYCLGSHGFLSFRKQILTNPPPPWQQRKPLALWRGSSTDAKNLELSSLPQSRRYQLCKMSRQFPDHLDASFTQIVQYKSEQDAYEIRDHLRCQGLLAKRIDPLEMAHYRWLLDLDGNVNSWGLLWKLLSGSCVIRVNSQRGQWFHHRLKPWQHLVPVANDLSDLREQLDWCQDHPRPCAEIAAEGQQLALDVLEDLGCDMITAITGLVREWEHTNAMGGGRQGVEFISKKSFVVDL